MTIKRKFRLLAALFAMICLALSALIALSPSPAYAANPYYVGPYDYNIDSYVVQYDLQSDRTMSVEERLTINHMGYSSTGFYRYIPVNAGDRVTNVSVCQISSGAETEVDYTVSLEDEFIVLNIGDYSVKTGKVITYIIRYNYAITKPVDKNTIYLNVIGYDWDADIDYARVTINLPEGFEEGQFFVGNTNVSSPFDVSGDGRTITATATNLSQFEGLSFSLKFRDGALKDMFDITPFIILIAGCVILAALAATKFLAFPKKPLTPVVNFTPPDEMDPVEMSKLIDNKIESRDVTTLIYYWANKGYLKIDFSDENDPLLIKIFANLPEGAPAHQQSMYNALFAGGRDMVKISQLEGNFYVQIDNVKKLVSGQFPSLYTSKSIAVSLIFTLLGGLLMGLTPALLTLFTINTKLFYYQSLLALVPALIIYALTETYKYSYNKLKKSTKILFFAGIIVLCAAFTAGYAWLLPSAVMEIPAKIVSCILAYAIIICSVSIISRSEFYTQKLNGIIGFRNFIIYAEKDRLEALLADNPQLYYDILPYAQVLNVSDIWEDKFKALTVEPPQWVCNPADTILTFALVNSAIRISNGVMTAKMVAKPSSRAYSGGARGGGHFGGFGGGGHGGGGGRGR